MAIAAWSYPFSSTFTLARGPLVPFAWDELVQSPGYFVVQPFAATGSPCFGIPLHGAKQVDDLGPHLDPKELYIDENRENEGLPPFDALVQRALEALHLGTLHKVVLSRYSDHAIEGFQPQWPRLLRLAYPSAFIALLSAPHLGTWITASPELFLGRHQEVLSSYSLAGTRFTAYGKLGEKERIEQQIVTRYIRQVFEKHGMGARVKPTTEHQAGQVAHLLNVVEGLLTKDKDLDLAGLIKGLHPTPAVGGFPKHQAIKFIREFEGYDRGLYTGFMGEFAHQGNFRYYVVLRCARIFHKVLRCFAGAGIVQGSVPSSELAETDAKMDVIRRVLLSRP